VTPIKGENKHAYARNNSIFVGFRYNADCTIDLQVLTNIASKLTIIIYQTLFASIGIITVEPKGHRCSLISRRKNVRERILIQEKTWVELIECMYSNEASLRARSECIRRSILLGSDRIGDTGNKDLKAGVGSDGKLVEQVRNGACFPI